MRSIFTAIACLTIFAGLTLAETFSGSLVDAACLAQQKAPTACAPTASTTTFGMVVSGRFYMLDENGNMKAAEALKDRADRQTEPNSADRNGVTATINGTSDGNVIKVDTIQVQ
jgi:hypothetical protein